MSCRDTSRKLASLFTKKHSTHDVLWMVQNSNADMLCFACLMEMLEDINELNFKKRKVVSEVLDVLTSTKLIWNIFSRNTVVLVHTGNVLLRLLFTKDKELSLLLVETLGILILKSKDDNSISILEALIDIIKEHKNTKQRFPSVYITLLGKLMRGSKMALCTIVDHHQWLLEEIAEKINKTEEEESVSYWYIFAQVYRYADAVKIGTGISKLVLQSMSDTIAKSTNKDLQLNVLAVLKHFSKSESLRQLFVDYENQEFACNGISFAESFKKLLLSPCNDVKIGAIQSVTELILTMPSKEDKNTCQLVENFIIKGLCEFLFELLNSSNMQVVESVLLCLIRFTNCQKFFTSGHLIFGLQPIASALSRIVEQKNQGPLFHALKLIHGIFEKADKTVFSQGKLLIDIMTSLAKLTANQETKILVLVVLCTKEIIDRLLKLDETIIKYVFKMLEDLGKRSLADAKDFAAIASGAKDKVDLLSATLEFVTSSFRLLKRFERGLAENQPDQQDKSQIIEFANPTKYVYCIMDKYCIPAMMLWLQAIKGKRIFIGFFHLITDLLSYSKNIDFAKKLAQSSFIRIASEVKCRFVKDDANEVLIPCINSFLQTLVCTFEDAKNTITLASLLDEVLPQLSIPPCDWHLFFTRRFEQSVGIDLHVIHCCQVACLALVYSTVRFGHPLWKAETRIKSLATYLLEDSGFKQLPDISKRHLIYLWSSARQSHSESLQSSKFEKQEGILMSFLSDSNTLDDCYFHDECYIRWILCSALKNEMKKMTLIKFFVDESHNTQILDVLYPFKENVHFYIMCIDVISKTAEENSLKALHVALELLKNNQNNTAFSETAKEFTHKMILSNATELRHTNLRSLFDIYRAIPLSHSNQLGDIDLKFAFRACNVFLECPYLDVRIAILNCLNFLLTYMRASVEGAAQVAILCDASFLKEVYSIIPHKPQFIDAHVEKLSAAGLVFISQISTILAYMNEGTDALPPMTFSKEALISGLAVPDANVFQLACIKFWKFFLAIRDKKPLMLQTGRGLTNLKLMEAKTILAYIQNLLFSQEKVLREAALQCFSVLVELLKRENNEFQNPWNIFLLEQATQDLVSSTNIKHSLKLLLVLLRLGTPVRHVDDFIVKSSSAIKQLRQEKHEKAFDGLILSLVFFIVDKYNVAQEVRDEWNCLLHEIEDRISGFSSEKQHETKENVVSFVEASGVVFPWENDEIPELNLKDIQQYRNKLTCARF